MSDPQLVPREALRFFSQKKLQVGFDYRDVWREEHATAFTVAKITETDVLGAVKGSLETALKEGQSFDSWRKNIRPELEKTGWWVRREVVDPKTGEIAETEIGAPARLRTIYDTNIRTANAAGSWDRIQRTKRFLPNLLYTVGPSAKHRPEHLAWHGTLLPADDPWWLTHFAPNGWGCKCSIRQVGRAEYERLVRDGIPGPGVQELDRNGMPTGRLIRSKTPTITTAPPLDRVPWKNKRTGITELVPRGIDPGFDSNPGARFRTVSQMRVLKDKLASADDKVAAAVVQSWVEGPALQNWLQKPFESVPIGVVRDAVASDIGAKTRVVMLSADTVTKQLRSHPEIVAGDYQQVAAVLQRGQAIQDTERSMIFVDELPDNYLAVVKSTMSGEGLFVTSFRRISRDAAKRDEELRRLLRKK